MWDCFVSSSWNGHGDAPAGNTAKKRTPTTLWCFLQRRRRRKNLCGSFVAPTKKKEINNKSKFQAPRRKAFIKETVDTRAKIVTLSTFEPTDVNSRARVARIFRVFDKNKRERKKERKKRERHPFVHFCVSLRWRQNNDDDVPLRMNLCL